MASVKAMLNRTITKNSVFVILLLFFCLISNGCFSVSSQKEQNFNKVEKPVSDRYEKPKVSGRIETKEITESSGLAASACQPDVFWTHNDSGDKAFVFAFDATGKKLGTYSVTGAENQDWEDMALSRNSNGECFLYIGDIGNNERLKSEFTIYRVREPKVSATAADSGKKNPVATEIAERIKFAYPDYRHDSETLMVHPKTGDIYILSKRLSGAASVYKLSKDFDLKKINTLEKITDITVPALPNGFLTGGDISPDGNRVIICDYFDGYELILPEKSKNFDDIWKQKPEVVELGERQQGEAVCYSADGGTIFATSEKKHSPIIQVKRK